MTVCSVCQRPLSDAERHRSDRECVEALRREVERLNALYALSRRAVAGGFDY